VSVDDRDKDSCCFGESREVRGKLDLVDSADGRGDASSSSFAERPLGVSGPCSDMAVSTAAA
jgi:hypothetical protein